MKKRSDTVLYLTYDGLTDPIGQAQVLPYILASTERGMKFHILSFEKTARQEKIRQTQELLDSKGIRWYRLDFTVGRNIFYKIWDFLKFVGTAIRITGKHRYAIIHSRSYFASSIGLLVRAIYGPKLIFDKRDFWIDANVETGRIRTSSPLHRTVLSVLRFFERRLFRKSEHIISLTHRAKQMVLDKYPERKPEDITVIPCCVDQSLFRPQSVGTDATAALRERLGLTGATIFGYVGSIGTAYMVPELLECFKTIRRKVPNARLLFLVNNDPEEVKSVAAKAGLSPDDIVVTSAPRADMPLHISVFDYGLFFITPTYAKKATSPTKMFEMLAMGKPIITNAGVGDAEKIFGDLNCGYLLPDTNAAEYEKVADWLAGRHSDACTYDLSGFSLQFGADNYYRVYQKLLS